MLDKFTFKEVNDVPKNTLYFSPKDRGIIQTLKDFIIRYDSIKLRAFNQQRIIDTLRATINANQDLIQTQQDTIESLQLSVRNLKITISEKNIKG